MNALFNVLVSWGPYILVVIPFLIAGVLVVAIRNDWSRTRGN